MINFISKIFSVDAASKAALNEVAKIHVEFEKASASIRKAEKKFNSVRETKISQFNALKQRTIEGTKRAVAILTEKVYAEEARIEETYKSAKEKINTKLEMVNRLDKGVQSLNSTDHGLG